MIVYVLHISKESQLDDSKFPNWVTEIGESKEACIQYVLIHYSMSQEQLIKNEADDYPYFTDGGFKYTSTGPYWKYTFVCYPQLLLKSL